jgi:hypothetical protein
MQPVMDVYGLQATQYQVGQLREEM